MTGELKERAAQLSALMEHIREQEHFNGVILIAKQGIPLLCDAMGIAEFSKDRVRTLTTDSMFELASVSKPITALGIIRLHQLGKLEWDDPVSRWLPDLPYPGITIRHLLTHTSGLPDYMELFAKKWNPAQKAVNNDVMDMLAAHRPASLFAPNDSWMYSNTGYIMLAILIERISGQSYAAFLSEQIFQPLSMTRTRVYNRRFDPGPVPKDYAWGYVYRLEHGGYVLPDMVPELNYVDYLDGLQGDGMVNSTVMDLLRLDRALYDDKFIHPQLREAMFAPVVLNNGESFDYGFGWLIEYHDQLGKMVWHSGGWPGYATLFKRYIEQDTTLILLQNGEREFAYTQQLIQSIEQILAGEQIEMPRPAAHRTIIPRTSEDYEPFLGEYCFSDEQEQSISVKVYVKHSQLYMRLGNEMEFLLLPISNVRFYEQQTATELEFIGTEAGKSIQFIWYDHEGQSVADRIEK
ncbi:serine hydrolase domain-containing protein [Paenibacillus sp. JJ-223]|uniref:serine hydrolase domain-containing protein n=1 Tax=Paenibacillus sp. JJ-223 TaxID=2905647 RepID=UPI001F45B323|nr:serine hydrolase domain-containing protein [Paenibacillus sp. JJ-223]CAH1211372.1 Penicillin-binding protein 4* [Paenibacillus sp. JJ-223]